MNKNTDHVSEAFSKQSDIFDALYKENKLSEYLRENFREEILSQIKPQATILELNCGTGMDAVFFAGKGHSILATDNAPGMLSQLDQKILNTPFEKNIRTLRCSFHNIDTLAPQKFDYIISDFGGLNCTDNLKDVLSKFAPLLNEGGKVTLMIMPKICPWELVMMFKGEFKTAFRRFKKNTHAHIEGVHFLCYYYNPGYVRSVLKKEFDLYTLKGICISVPPEFYQNFVERYPKIFSFLKKLDKMICKTFPFTYTCDHYMITFQKKK